MWKESNVICFNVLSQNVQAGIKEGLSKSSRHPRETQENLRHFECKNAGENYTRNFIIWLIFSELSHQGGWTRHIKQIKKSSKNVTEKDKHENLREYEEIILTSVLQG
jgi:hypothetical protein